MKQKNAIGHPSVGIALGGGAARGIAHIGVLQALVDNNIPVDCIAGTSAGAIVAAAFAFGIPLETIRQKAKRLNWYMISVLPGSVLGLASNSAIDKMLRELIGGADISESKIPLAVVATKIETGEKVVFRNGKTALAVRASACIPGLFYPVEIKGIKLVDGELSESLPLSPLLDMGADIKIGVSVLHWRSRKKVGNLLDIISNSLDIMASHKEDRASENADVVIEPDLGAYGPSDFKKADALIAEGYRAASLKIPEIKKLLSRATKKQKPQRFFDRFWDWLKK